MLQFGIPGGPELLIILLILLLFVAVPLVVIAGAIVFLIHRRRTSEAGTTDPAGAGDPAEPAIRARDVDTDSSPREESET